MKQLALDILSGKTTNSVLHLKDQNQVCTMMCQFLANQNGNMKLLGDDSTDYHEARHDWLERANRYVQFLIDNCASDMLIYGIYQAVIKHNLPFKIIHMPAWKQAMYGYKARMMDPEFNVKQWHDRFSSQFVSLNC